MIAPAPRWGRLWPRRGAGPWLLRGGSCRGSQGALALKTTPSFERARAICNEGGHSKSCAKVTLLPPLAVVVKDMAGNVVGSGKLYADYAAGTQVLDRMLYPTSNDVSDHVGCQVGLLADTQTNNYFASGDLMAIGATECLYS